MLSWLIRHKLITIFHTGVHTNTMNYTLIKGTFHVVGQSPDGDSLKFRASNPKSWDKIITENREKLLENMEENEGVVQLRLQGVDALETHYSPPPARPPSPGHEPPAP